MKNANVLLVDDDAKLLHGISRTLRDQPFKLLTARTADEALHIIKSHPIHVVVSDERMPGKSGTELLAWIAEQCPDVVRIFMTGYTTPNTTERAINEGRVFRYFSKPFDSREMGEAIIEGLLQQEYCGDTATAT